MEPTAWVAYPKVMSSTPLTLAALATSAVPDLEPLAVRPYNPAGQDFRSAVLTTASEELLVSVPKNHAAEVSQAASLLAFSALTEGARAQLPFAVPEGRGMTRSGDTRAVVSTFLIGGRIDPATLAADSLLVDPIAAGTAAIHALPRSVVQQGGLPVRTANDLRLLATRIIDRADATRFLPNTVHRRWLEVIENAELWDFSPVVTHGSLNAEALLVEDDEILGVLGWSECGIGDPAADLAWLHGASNGAFAAVLDAYLGLVDTGNADALTARSRLYHELEIAKWLLHGVENHDREVVDDAVRMLDRFVDALTLLAPATVVRGPLNADEALDLLGQTPEVTDHMSDTAAYEALDEDRMFGNDTDFIEPISAANPGDAVGTRDTSSTSGATAASTEETAGAAVPDVESSDDQVTEAYGDDDLAQSPQQYSAGTDDEHADFETDVISDDVLPTPDQHPEGR